MGLAELIERLEHVYIDPESADSPVAQRIQSLIPNEKISVAKESELGGSQGRLTAKQFDRSKRQIFVTPFKGKFFKRCPGARPGLTCCNYFVLNLGQQCDMNCSYCYLQSFLNYPLMKIYSNIDQALGELREMGAELASQSMRIGTGEVIDSLSMDELTLYSMDLIEFFRDYPNWRLEFKTKSDRVDQFLEVEHAKNVIVSWSINPQDVIDHEEHGTANLEARFQAAEKALAKDFLVAFHIDPMVEHPNWKANYEDLVKEICRRFPADRIPYVSVGALRFQPEQRHMMRERFGPESWINQAELFPGSDSKYRYDSQLRREMYNTVLNQFRKFEDNWKVFLCMENPETWLANYEARPKSVDGLKELFDHQPIRKVNQRLTESSVGN